MHLHVLRGLMSRHVAGGGQFGKNHTPSTFLECQLPAECLQKDHEREKIE
jgi:hypothetical protein